MPAPNRASLRVVRIALILWVGQSYINVLDPRRERLISYRVNIPGVGCACECCWRAVDVTKGISKFPTLHLGGRVHIGVEGERVTGAIEPIVDVSLNSHL